MKGGSMDFWWGFAVGLFLGANVGLLGFAVVFGNRKQSTILGEE